MSKLPLRWIAVSVFVISSTLNYLDRQLLAAGAPAIQSEFHLGNQQYGEIVSIFSIVYAVFAPLAGLFVDRVGLNLGVGSAVLVWSFAGIGTGLASTFRGLIGSRTLLGVAEAAGIPGFGKANGLYLEPRELALGTAINQVGISVALIGAPLVMGALQPHYGWRMPFIVCGIAGLFWIPIWWLTAARIPHRVDEVKSKPTPVVDLLRDRKLWGLVVGCMLIMTLYTLWTNWTTLYFVHERHLDMAEANRHFAWIPPLFGTLGGFFGGWMAFRSIRTGGDVVRARLRVCWMAAVFALLTAVIPWMPNSITAAIAISASYFWVVCISTNLYSLPIDLFGPGRAAFGVSALTFAYGLMQALISPRIGAIVDRVGFATVCVSVAALPLAGVWALRVSTK